MHRKPSPIEIGNLCRDEPETGADPAIAKESVHAKAMSAMCQWQLDGSINVLLRTELLPRILRQYGLDPS